MDSPERSPSPSTARLLERLAVTATGDGDYVARSVKLRSGSMFGGQMVSQAIAAAAATVDARKPTASAHMTYLERGDGDAEVRYSVDELRTGRTDVRLVRVSQGRLCALATVAFMDPDQTGHIDHHVAAPPTPSPSEVPSLGRMDGRAVLVRAEDGHSPFDPDAAPAEFGLWMRSDDSVPDPWLAHHQLLAYCSDLTLTATPFRPVGGVSFGNPDDIVSATRSFHLWFHRPFRFDDWLYLHHRCASASGGRALVHAHWFDQARTLVASVTQETVSDLRR